MFLCSKWSYWLAAIAVTLVLSVTACLGDSGKEPAIPNPTLQNKLPGDKQPDVSSSPVRTVSAIKASVASSKLLDGKHLAAGVDCEGCHGILSTEEVLGFADTAKCLSCHGSTYSALATKTAALADMNPHNSHIGQVDCAKCHLVHESYEYYCNNCHSFALPQKFKSGT